MTNRLASYLQAASGGEPELVQKIRTKAETTLHELRTIMDDTALYWDLKDPRIAQVKKCFSDIEKITHFLDACHRRAIYKGLKERTFDVDVSLVESEDPFLELWPEQDIVAVVDHFDLKYPILLYDECLDPAQRLYIALVQGASSKRDGSLDPLGAALFIEGIGDDEVLEFGESLAPEMMKITLEGTEGKPRMTPQEFIQRMKPSDDAAPGSRL